MRVIVFGAGATGCLFAARLAASGLDVEIVGRPAVVRAALDAGLTVRGDRPVGPVRLSATTELSPGSDAEVVLLTVKTFDLAAAAKALGRSLQHPVPIALLQNGLTVEERFAAELGAVGWPHPERSLVRVVHSVPSTLLAPGVVANIGEGEFVIGDRPPDHGDPAAHAVVAETLRRIGPPVRSVPRLLREVWRKAIVNAAINPVTADHGIVNGRLLDDPYRQQAMALLGEARLAAELAGERFTPAETETALFRIVRATAQNRSSMLQDIEQGRPTEIDAISGEILRIARAHGRELPWTARAVQRIHRRVDAARPPAGPDPSRASEESRSGPGPGREDGAIAKRPPLRPDAPQDS